MIDAGTKVNIIPNRCRLSVDCRMIPGEITATVMRELKLLVTLMLKEEDLDIVIKMRPVNWDAYLISEEEPIVWANKEAFKAVTGRSPEILARSAGTDASYLFHIGRIPTVLFGLGNQYMSHGRMCIC